MSDIIKDKETEGGRDIVCKSVEDYANLRAEESRIKINEFIEYLYLKENKKETISAMKDALNGNTVGPFDSIEALMDDLYAED